MDVTCRSMTNYQVDISAGSHHLIADEPPDVGGDDAGPKPQLLLLGALGSCVVITVEMYAKRKTWPLTSVEVKLTLDKMLAQDCEDCTSAPDEQVGVISMDVKFEGDLTAEQVMRLTEIAGRCPVHKLLTGEIKIRTLATGPAQPA